MFIGHEAVALAAKRFLPRTSLGTLLMAVQFPDLLWPLFLLAGIEHVRIDPGNTAFTPLDFYAYPYSHSLLFVLFWSVVFGLGYYDLRRDARAAWITGGAVLSHWILDAVAHRPDLPLYPGGRMRVGLGLWDSVPGTLIVEFSMLAISIVVYLRSTTAKGISGHIRFWGFIAALIAIYLGAAMGPPPTAQALPFMALSGWLLVLWGYWIDRTRPASGGLK